VVTKSYPSLAQRMNDDPHIKKFVQESPVNQDGMVMLDIGCGYGQFAYHLALSNPKSEIIGCDLSESFLEMAKMEGARLANLRFALMNMFNMTELPDKSLDFMFATYAIHVKHQNDLTTLFRHFAAKLKKGGSFRFILNTVKAKDGVALPDEIEQDRGIPITLHKTSKTPFNLVDFCCTEDEITQALNNAGFKCLRVEGLDTSEKMNVDFKLRKDVLLVELIVEAIRQ